MAYEYIKGKFAASGDKSDIPQEQSLTNLNYASYDNGFPAICSEAKDAGGLPPHRADLNEALYLSLGNLYEFQSGNYPTFLTANTAGYPTGAILYCAAEGRFVKSTKDANTDNFITTPSYIGTSWVFVNASELTSIATGLTLSISTTYLNIAAGRVASNLGRILSLSTTQSVNWTTLQTDSGVSATANTKYYVFLVYNPTTLTYKAIINASAGAPDNLPSGYTDYALLGYLNTDASMALNLCYPSSDLPTVFKKRLGSFGARIDKTSNYGAQQALTDGIIEGYFANGGDTIFKVYNDNNPNPTTLILNIDPAQGNDGGLTFSFTVAKGEYWKIICTGWMQYCSFRPIGI